MKLWKYVLIGLMGILLVACESGGKDAKNGKNEINKSVEDKTLNSKSDIKTVKEVSVSGYNVFRGNKIIRKKITFILGKTTFKEVSNAIEYNMDKIEIPNTPKKWVKIKDLAYFDIPNVGDFEYMFLTFDDGVLSEIHLSSPKYNINLSVLENALNMKYNKIGNVDSSLIYDNNNGVTVSAGINGNYAYLHYELDSFTKQKDDLIAKNTKEASSFL